MDGQHILMGVVGRPHGVRGLVRVHSYAAVPADLASYGVLSDDRGGSWTLRWQGEGIAALTDASGRTVGDRDQAASLVNRRLYVDRGCLPKPEPDEFYLSDLIGLAAVERRADGEQPVGVVVAVHDYGAGSSLEIGRSASDPHSIFLPFTRACVPDIDLAAGRVVVVRPDEIEVRDDAAPTVPSVAQAIPA